MKNLVLIIDDDIHFSDFLKDLIEEQGVFAYVANSIEKAKSLLYQHSFKIIFLDINLKGRNGAEILKFLIDSPLNENSKTNFVIMSGFIEDTFIEKNKDRFSAILKKPFDPEEIYSVVKKCIDCEIAENKFLDDIPIAFCEKPFSVPGIQDDLIQYLLDVKVGSQLRNALIELKTLGNNHHSINHIGKIINVAMALYEKLDWKSDKIFEKIVLAAYLHDYSIKSKPELMKLKSLEEIDSNQVALGGQNYFTVFNHPEKSYVMLASLDNIHLDVLSMVRYHHEQPNGKGFPNKVQYTKLNALVSLFIAAHDFVNYCEENPNEDINEFLNIKSSVYTGPIFKKIMKAFSQLKISN